MGQRRLRSIPETPDYPLMLMLMVHVGHVRMRVAMTLMSMGVSMRLARRIARCMLVLVVRIMHVRMACSMGS